MSRVIFQSDNFGIFIRHNDWAQMREPLSTTFSLIYLIYYYLLDVLHILLYTRTNSRPLFSAIYYSVLFRKQPKQIKHESNNSFHNMHLNCLHFSAFETFVLWGSMCTCVCLCEIEGMEYSGSKRTKYVYFPSAGYNSNKRAEN